MATRARKSTRKKKSMLRPMRVLRIEPGDMIVLQTDLMLDKNQVQALRDRAVEQFGTYFPDVKVVVLSAGLKAGAIRKVRKPVA